MDSMLGPSTAVLSAFGLRGTPVRLPGGQATSWRVGDVALKPGVDPVFQEWLGTEVAAIPQRGFRLPAVLRAVDGSWCVEGWAAQSVLPGSACAGSVCAGSDAGWPAVIDAARALHAGTSALARPEFLDARTDPWAVADRGAWGERTPTVVPELGRLVDRLRPALAPLGTDQLVHGDLTGNVLLLPDGSPGIIDVSPYWRPPSFAEGVVIADALSWHDASPSLLDEVDVAPAAVARGLLFRILTAGTVHQRHGAVLLDEAERYRSAIDALRL